jgi:hypothetical protein
MPLVIAWRSDVYHVLPIGDAYIEVRIKFSTVEFLVPYFLNPPVYTSVDY